MVPFDQLNPVLQVLLVMVNWISEPQLGIRTLKKNVVWKKCCVASVLFLDYSVLCCIFLHPNQKTLQLFLKKME